MMMLKPDLFDFAFVPDWYGQLNELREMALPEPWRFKKPMNETKNQDTPILERYLHIIFRKQCIEFNFHSTRDIKKSSQFFHVENERACFHTGLYNSRYKGIYAFFERNHKKDSMLDWYFRGFCDELSPWLRYIQPLLDVRQLLTGGKVPLVKTGDTWMVSLHQLAKITELLKNSRAVEQKGMTYQEYLGILLMTGKPEVQTERTMDIVEAVIRGMSGKENFRLDQGVIYLEVDMGVTFAEKTFSLQRDYGYAMGSD